MKTVHRIFVVIITVMMLMAPCLHSIYASENNEVQPDFEQIETENNSVADDSNDPEAQGIQVQVQGAVSAETEIVPFAADTPTTYYNLDSSSYRAQIVELAAARATNTARYFSTSADGITVTYYLSSCGTAASTARTMQIRLYKRSSDTSSWVQVGSHPVSFDLYGSGIAFFYDLDPNSFYYVSFRNTSSSTPWLGLDINGYADIESAH